ncbi:molybdenum ABC transporter ATP-binding protein [Aliiglaciecola sp.]|nr:molybdenum ABC transporter ATP-binding protein [Aliiglaciecola sp.]
MMINVAFRQQYDSCQIALDIQIPNKGVTAVFGPSGAGKSTLLRVIAGLESIDDATVSVGDDIWQSNSRFVATHERGVGMVFQQPCLFEHLTVEQNILYSTRLGRARKSLDEYRVDDFISRFGLAPLMQRLPHTLSGGEQQRVAIVRAIAAQPKVLLMDEPLSSLDDGLKAEFMDELGVLLQNLHLPVVYVTHSLAEVAKISQHLLLIEQGKCVGQGKTNELLTDLDSLLAKSINAKSALEATVISHDTKHHMSVLATSAGDLFTTKIDKPISHKLKVVIQAKDVSVTLSRQQDTSILNVLEGQVVGFENTESGRVTLKVSVNSCFILSQITQRSFSQLAIDIGCKVFIQIKSMALC